VIEKEIVVWMLERKKKTCVVWVGAMMVVAVEVAAVLQEATWNDTWNHLDDSPAQLFHHHHHPRWTERSCRRLGFPSWALTSKEANPAHV
jgi:hypothetical protein